MKRARTKHAWAVALAVALTPLLFVACTADSKSYPTQPAARNVIPGIETGPVAASFTCQADSADPLTLVCQDTSTGPIESWRWDFGDGRSSTAQNPRHTYKEAGTYVVVLTVTGPSGSSGASVIVTVGQSTPPPAS
jgi:PKD repeat protein